MLIKLSKILLLTCTIFLCFYKLPNHPVQQWDELTNINVVSESLRSENALVLRYNSEPFLEKPPLWYWLTMGIVKILDESIFSFRLLSAVSGFFLTFIVYKIAKDFWGELAGITSGFSILATGHLFINNVSGYFSTHNFRSADLDILQILFIMISFWFLYAGFHAKKNSDIIKNLGFGFLFSGLAVMTKGFFGILPILFTAIFSIVRKTLHKPRFNFLTISEKLFISVAGQLSGIFKIIVSNFFTKVFKFISEKLTPPKISAKTFFLPILVFLLIVLPWHLFMCVEYGNDFIRQYFLYHTFQRATQTLEFHSEPIWFYVQMLFNTKVFFSKGLLLMGIFFAILKKDFLSDFRRLASVSGVLLPLFFFSLIPTKLAWYNLYTYPFAALVVAFLAKEFSSFRNDIFKYLGIIIIYSYISAGLIRNLAWVLSL